MSIPSYKEQPAIYNQLVTVLMGAAAKWGIKLDATQVLAVLLVAQTIATGITTRRTVAIHPSSGETVGSKVVEAGIAVAPPKGSK